MIKGDPQEETRKAIGKRIAEERARVGMPTQPPFAKCLGVSLRSVAGWEGGEVMPKADFVSAFEALGIDVLYVLTGRRGGSLSDDESRLVSLYKRIPVEKRGALLGMAEAVANDGPPVASSSAQQTFHGPVGNVHSVHQGSMTNHYTEAAAKARPRRAK